MRRAGSVRSLFPREPDKTHTLGRKITCQGCGQVVDVIEIRLTVNATGSSMRPDLCGTCQPLAAKIEPVIEVCP